MADARRLRDVVASVAFAVLAASLYLAADYLLPARARAEALVAVQPGHADPGSEWRETFTPLATLRVDKELQALDDERLVSRALGDAAPEFAAHFKVRPVDSQSSLVRLSLTGSDADRVVAMLDAIVDAVVADATERDRARASAVLDALVRQVQAVRDERAAAVAAAGTNLSVWLARDAVRMAWLERQIALERARLVLESVGPDIDEPARIAVARRLEERAAALEREGAAFVVDDGGDETTLRAATVDARYRALNERIAALALYTARGRSPVRVLDAANLAGAGPRTGLMFGSLALAAVIVFATWWPYRRTDDLARVVGDLASVGRAPVLALLPWSSGTAATAEFSASPVGDDGAGDPAADLAVSLLVELGARATGSVCIVDTGDGTTAAELATRVADVLNTAAYRAQIRPMQPQRDAMGTKQGSEATCLSIVGPGATPEPQMQADAPPLRLMCIGPARTRHALAALSKRTLQSARATDVDGVVLLLDRRAC